MRQDGGKQGLATGRKVHIVLASGGIYPDGPTATRDHATPYLKAVLGLIVIIDVEVIRVEGPKVGADGAADGVAAARAQIALIAA